MKPINVLLSLLSLNAVIVIVERLSPTTKILLQPYNFLRLHEVVQMLAVIPLSFIISYLLLKIISDDFRLLRSVRGTVLGIVFVLGLYLTATGNGAHETAGFIYNTFCNTTHIGVGACASAYINDYYFGNIVYFLGLLLSNLALILLERSHPDRTLTRNDIVIVGINGVIYALTLFAYSAFDVVAVGMWFTLTMAVLVDWLLLTSKTRPKTLPFTLYSAVAYSLAAVATVLVRFK